MTAPLKGLRVAVTIPPHGWFGGVDFDFATEMTAELRALGASVLELDTGGFFAQNPLHFQDAVEALRRFDPDVALPLPNALYLLLCKNSRGENIFRDVLEIPSIMLWDHGLFQLPRNSISPVPRVPAETQTGAIQRIRAAVDHPLYHHYSPDRGHIEALHRVGLLRRDQVQFFLQPTYPNFARHGYRPPSTGAFRTKLAFAGNVYLKAASSLSFAAEPELMAIQEEVMSAKLERLTVPLWDLLIARLDGLRRTRRRQLGLVPDSTFFWTFVHDEVEVVGNTRVRLHVLTGLAREFEFYGNFVEPTAVASLRTRYRINVRKSLDYFTELPLLFMNSDVIVDIVNLGYNTGISPKIMGCLACGGLVLFDYKQDFADAFGEVGGQVMYRSVEELNTLVDRYLGNAALRRDVSRYLQHQVATRYSFGRLCERILVEEPLWRGARGRARGRPQAVRSA